MRKLYHYWLCPFSRKVRLVLNEKKLDHELVLEKPWENRYPFLELNPEGVPPVLQDGEGRTIANAYPICEYLDEAYHEHCLIGENAMQRAEVRRLVAWFDGKFNREVTHNLVFEKVMKKKMGLGNTDTATIRAGMANIHDHLEYITWLTERRNWLAGEAFSLADITAAAHLSSVDYLGDVPWEKHIPAKEWYARIKSRPSFQPLLNDIVPAIMPAPHYTDLDF